MDIKQQALEAARPHAHDIDDLIEKASKIEAYLLGTSSLSPIIDNSITDKSISDSVDPTDKFTEHLQKSDELKKAIDDDDDADDELKKAIDDDADIEELISLAKGLTSDLAAMGFADPDMAQYARYTHARNIAEREKIRMREMADLVEKCDLSKGSPLPDTPDLKSQFSMSNYEIVKINGGIRDIAKLRPMQLDIGEMMINKSIVVNVCRQFGTTTMIAAFARQQRINGYKILVITNTHNNVIVLNELINDASVNVYAFSQIAERTWAGETYDYIIIDNAAFIPYSMEGKISRYVLNCKIKNNIDQLEEITDLGYFTKKMARGLHIPSSYLSLDNDATPSSIGDDNTHSTKIAMFSVPCQKKGWFYNEWNAPIQEWKITKLSTAWNHSGMTKQKADELRSEVGETVFSNQFENQFRTVEEPTGNTDLTK